MSKEFLIKALCLVAIVPLFARCESLAIMTPASVVVCQPTVFSWSGGQSPYTLSIVPGAEPSGAPLKSFEKQDGTSFSWMADVPSGTSISLLIKDASGQEALSAPFTIQDGPDSSCLPAH